MTPNKFFYDFNAATSSLVLLPLPPSQPPTSLPPSSPYYLYTDMREFAVCYGSNWEPTFAWLNLRLDDIRRSSQDPSKPPLGWWDRIRLNYHGRLGFACGRMIWLYPTSLDPYNSAGRTDGGRPRCFLYTNVLKLFDRLKMCLTRVSRPIRKGAVFSCIKPKKPLFGQLLQ
ncbi:unnamed protein product [Dibothriocephalus latus]|uniref:FMP27/BLTP2/Hobbit GFWDK motif-containing RBG unit domain-containing protein n=1 Tax=Dibothriocephalus latus TaxID=60516 RepID=A0A3P7QVR1_DIBLA|nr:unnamed protein product [Dibothriocephalus latus]